MGLVKVLFIFDDGGVSVNKTTELADAYRISERDVLCEEDNFLVIRQVTSETEDVLILDFEKTQLDPNYINPIFIELENIKGIDYTHDSVINFAKYFIQIRDGE
jgi:hypothetical protein